MRPLGHGVTEVVQDLLKTSFRLSRVRLLLKGNVGVDVQQFHLLVDVVHRSLKVALFPVGRKVQRLKRRKGPHQLFVAQVLLVLGSDFPADGLELFPREIYSILLDELN